MLHPPPSLPSTQTLVNLPAHRFRVPPTQPVKTVMHELQQRTDLPGVLVMEGETFHGMVSRQKCFELLSRRFGTDLFLNKPIQVLMTQLGVEVTILPVDTTVEDAVTLALTRPLEVLYEPIVTYQADGPRYQIIDITTVLLAQSNLLAHANQVIYRQAEIARSLSSTLETRKVMRLILEGIGDIVPYERAGIILKNGETLELSAGQMVIPAPQRSGWEAMAQMAVTHGWIALPLLLADEIIGILYIAPQDPADVQNRELELVRAYAAQAAIPIQNARLFEEVKHLAVTDPLTRLYNRRVFFELATAALSAPKEDGRTAALILLDIDHFKDINDHYGHQAGDLVLERVAQICRENLRDKDLIARYGGEEFIFLLPDTPMSSAQQAADRICDCIAHTPIVTSAGIVSITVSAGITGVESTGRGIRLETLIERADEALYNSKVTGRNRTTVWTDRSESHRLPPGAAGIPQRSLQANLGKLNRLSCDGMLQLLLAGLQATHDGIMILDRQGTVLWVNRGFTAITGYEPDEVVDRKAWDYGTGRGCSVYAQALEAAVGGGAWHDQSITNRRDGSLYLEEMTVQPVYTGTHEVTHLVVTKRDITDREKVRDDYQRRTEELERRLAEMDAVNRVSTAMRAAHTLDEMLPRLLSETLAVLDCHSGAVWLFNTQKCALLPVASQGWFGNQADKQFQPGEGIVGSVFQTGSAYIVPEFVKDNLSTHHGEASVPPGWGGACIPIRTAERNVGVLLLAVELPRQIGRNEVDLLTTLAEIAGNAIHRTQLSDETARQLQRLQVLRGIDLRINHSAVLQDTLDYLLANLTVQLNVQAAQIFLYNDQDKMIRLQTAAGLKSPPVEVIPARAAGRHASKIVLERTSVYIPEFSEQTPAPKYVDCAAEGLNGYFGLPLIAKGQVKGVLEVFTSRPLHPESEWVDFLETLAGQAAIAISQSQLFERLQQSNAELAAAYDQTLESWDRMLELRDQETEGHTQRVVCITVELARSMGVGEAEIAAIRRGALLHDMGKMGIPDSILLKPGPLNDDEWEVMKKHPALVYELLSSVPYLEKALEIPYCHHEKWDGSGYPRGLAGDEIPLAARIFSVVDVWDALSSNRPYRLAWDRERIIQYVLDQAGKQFDPQVVAAFMQRAPTPLDTNRGK